MLLLLLVYERDDPGGPVNLRIVSLQPGHAKDGIISLQGQGHKIQAVLVGADGDGRRLHDAVRGLLAAVGQSD
jgi:hypothetical protein